MQTTRRNGPVTARKKRLWAIKEADITLAAASVGVASQAIVNIGTQFTTQSDINLRGATVGRVFINGVISSIPASTPGTLSVGFGLIVAHTALGAGEFPNLLAGSGDYFVRDARSILEVDDNVPGNRPYEPHGVANGGGSIMIDGKSKRMVGRLGETVFFVGQKDTVSEQPVKIAVTITILYLY